MAAEKSQDEARADRRKRRPQTWPTTRVTVAVEKKAQHPNGGKPKKADS